MKRSDVATVHGPRKDEMADAAKSPTEDDGLQEECSIARILVPDE